MIFKTIAIFKIFSRGGIEDIHQSIKCDRFVELMGLPPEKIELFFGSFAHEFRDNSRVRTHYRQAYSVDSTLFGKTVRLEICLSCEPVAYVYMQFKLFDPFGEKSIEAAKLLLGRGLGDWFVQLCDIENYKRIYIGNLSGLRKYLMQDPSLVSENLPLCIGFESDLDLLRFSWVQLNLDQVK